MSDPNQPTHITVTVHGARELHSTNLITKMDPYCIVTMGSHTFKTNVDDHGNNTPTWNQTFKMDYAGEAQMRFRVMDKDKLTKDDYVGMADVTLSPIVYGTRLYNAEIELTRKEGRRAGYLKITIEFDPKVKANESAPPSSASAPTFVASAPCPAGYTIGYGPSPMQAAQPVAGMPYYAPPAGYPAGPPAYGVVPSAAYAPPPVGYTVSPGVAAYPPPAPYGQPPAQQYYAYPPGNPYPPR
ncbi:putative Elicitor-responsive protein [Besnoitia besnoiti]|uniref:Putative Elicitor-responsive protein n=1 Tax=Besnoitia besnoiti TaxID=94643 RepID=A0A2A9MGP9_BESBE|nr:putative Elicitor-responsive protein [Besnoitia besnoiti]PFH34600.1 putative Elicitor-responsive protein [Besnoitia besnoiti]